MVVLFCSCIVFSLQFVPVESAREDGNSTIGSDNLTANSDDLHMGMADGDVPNLPNVSRVDLDLGLPSVPPQHYWQLYRTRVPPPHLDQGLQEVVPQSHPLMQRVQQSWIISWMPEIGKVLYLLRPNLNPIHLQLVVQKASQNLQEMQVLGHHL
jgi:hypothetical protein